MQLNRLCENIILCLKYSDRYLRQFSNTQSSETLILKSHSLFTDCVKIANVNKKGK